MNRRTFSATGLAAILAPLPRSTSAEAAAQKPSGYQVAAINRGLLMARHSGMADEQSAVDDDTLFQVASCSKTVTALAVLTMVRDGRIDLDAPVNRSLRRWQLPGPRGMTATIANLMSHTAGTTVQGFEGYGPNEELPTLLDILAGRRPANSSPVRTRPRIFNRFRYSGGGTMVLQSLIEDVTGMDFATYTAKEVLEPVGASRATFAIAPATPFAHGCYEDGQSLQGGFRRHPESAAAGLWATASDLAKVFQAVLHALGGLRHAIIPVALAERMVTPVSQGSGLGVFLSPGPTISHQGRNHGFDSIVAANLKTGQIRAAVTNRNGAINSYTQQLLSE
ncbi:beta-lactamase family protein [Tateyamaria omphalii]|uniref:serine hydrolase domain-containing protein n=1 Tax=Tateyamaria omphalii TaxID=299262 RepID=UPI001C9948F1|nr:serine hydrolase domain-containing protein [Tateyamaria omphalii]MBY5931488.1 beta-lactamase family protein [Tateyamaria omphalii]